MSEQTRTRHFSAEELELILAPFARARQPAPARPTRGAGTVARAGENAPRALTRLRHVDAQLGARVREPHPMRAWQAWMLVFALGGFSLGGVLAIATHHTQGRVPPALPAAPTAQRPPLPARMPDHEAHEDVEAAPQDMPITVDALTVGGSIADRRRAVDALFAGRARVALEQYQRVLAAQRAQLTDAVAIEHVVTLLARELRACEQEAGTPCGL